MKNKDSIKEYTKRTAKLDSILNKLTRSYCANKCSSVDGCCVYNCYNFDVPDEMIKLQEDEALENGWEKEGRRCKYHSDIGCKLTLFKPPVCINTLCIDLKTHIETEYGFENSLPFIDAMKNASVHNLTVSPEDRDILFLHMDQAIAFGEKLIESKKQWEGK